MLGIQNAPAEMRTLGFGLPHRGDGLSKKRLWKHLVLQSHFTDSGPHPPKRPGRPQGSFGPAGLENGLPILGCSLPHERLGPLPMGSYRVAGKAAKARIVSGEGLQRADRGPSLPDPTPAGPGALHTCRCR